jgi:hypothetical protein
MEAPAMSFEDERLAILQRVSRGELSPQDGQLEIAMLKVKHQQSGEQEPGLSQSVPHEDPRGQGPYGRNPFFAQGRSIFGPDAQPLKLTWPMGLALAIPFVMIGGVLLTGLALFLAFPTYLLVSIWNSSAASHAGWPLLPFWPTLFGLVAAFSLFTLLKWARRIRAAMQRQP